jgi:hypothetical protein
MNKEIIGKNHLIDINNGTLFNIMMMITSYCLRLPQTKTGRVYPEILDFSLTSFI